MVDIYTDIVAIEQYKLDELSILVQLPIKQIICLISLYIFCKHKTKNPPCMHK